MPPEQMLPRFYKNCYSIFMLTEQDNIQVQYDNVHSSVIYHFNQ